MDGLSPSADRIKEVRELAADLLAHCDETIQTPSCFYVGFVLGAYIETNTLLGITWRFQGSLQEEQIILKAGKNTVGSTYLNPPEPAFCSWRDAVLRGRPQVTPPVSVGRVMRCG